MSLQSVQDQFIHALKDIYAKEEAANICKIAYEKVLGVDPKQSSHREVDVNKSQAQQLKRIIKRLLKHEPIQYIVNECWFYNIPFFVDKKVLIPRPETEELVDWVIKENKSKNHLTILDIGTGSGCIPVILKRKIPSATVYSCDASAGALQVARKNSETHRVEINLLQVDFLNEKNWSLLPEFDIIVSNPPYIPEGDKNQMQKNVLDHEPHVALFVKNNDPLVFYKAIANFGLQQLKAGGAIYVEIHESLGENVTAIFHGKDYHTVLKKDMQEKDRMVKASLI